MNGVALKVGTVITLVGMAMGGTAVIYKGDADAMKHTNEKIDNVREEFNDELYDIKKDVKANGRSLTRIETILVQRYGNSVDVP